MKRLFRIMLIIGLFLTLFTLTSCGKTSEGLQFYFNERGKFYELVGLGTCKDEDIVIPGTYNDYPVRIIANSAFRDCKTIKSITISKGITTITSHAFRNCENLETLKLADSVTSISGSALGDCKKLKKVTLSKNLQIIDDRLFEDCISLEKITIPKGVTVIGSSAFEGCVKLKNVKLPLTLKIIQNNAFEDCKSLKKITIPVSVEKVEAFAFTGCYQTTIYYDLERIPSGFDSYWSKGSKNVVLKGQKQKNTFEAEYKKDDFETRVVEGLSEEMYLEISKAYAKNYFVDYGLSIQKFYGEYNGAYVFSNRSTRTEPTSKIVIGSVEFPECPVIINVMVYKNGYVYTLREAYEIRNTINVEDLKQIKEQIELKGYFNNGE